MTQADLDRVMEIAASLPEAPHWPPAAYLTALDLKGAPARIALVAEGSVAAGALVGFAVASVIGPQAELETIGVAAEAQHAGLAQRMFVALAGELKKIQVEEILLEVRASNCPALGFYRSMGFEEAGRRLRYYSDPIEDAVLMILRLG
jgi:ribosomal-protein-alanine N-acetyltransferase